MYDPTRGYPRVTPFVLYKDPSAAVAWISDVLDFREALRFSAPDGTVPHVELERDGFVIMLGLKGGRFGETSTLTFIFVDDVDSTCERAQAAGGRVLAAAQDYPYGLRQAVVEDPEGQRWEVSQHLRDVLPEEWGAEQFRPLPG